MVNVSTALWCLAIHMHGLKFNEKIDSRIMVEYHSLKILNYGNCLHRLIKKNMEGDKPNSGDSDMSISFLLCL